MTALPFHFKFRAALAAIAGAALLFPAMGPPSRATAAPAKSPKAKPPTTLTFRVTAHYGTKDATDGSMTTDQALDAKVFAKGLKARVETVYSDRPLVLLLTPPYAYRLLPNAKAGVRYHMNSETSQTLSSTNLAAFLRDPSALRALLRQGGAKPTGTEVVNGEKLDVWTASQFAKHPAKVKAWLRPSDALPMRLQVSSRTVQLAASWRDYRKGTTLADSLFAVPAGFRVRDSQDMMSPF